MAQRSQEPSTRGLVPTPVVHIGHVRMFMGQRYVSGGRARVAH